MVIISQVGGKCQHIKLKYNVKFLKNLGIAQKTSSVFVEKNEQIFTVSTILSY